VPFSRTEPNVPAYEEDPNSPFTATQQTSLTVQLATPSKNLLVLSDPSVVGYNDLQVNGVTGSVYAFTRRDATLTSGSSSIAIPIGFTRTSLRLHASDIGLRVTMGGGSASRDEIVAGATNDVTGPITEMLLFDSNGVSRDARVRVYRLDV